MGNWIVVGFKCWISCVSTLMFNMLFCQDVCWASGLFPSLPLTALACLWSRYLNSWQSYKQLWPWSFCAWRWYPWEAHLRDLTRKWHKLLQCFTGRGFSIFFACLLWWLAFDWHVLSPRCCTVWLVFTCFCIVSYQWSTQSEPNNDSPKSKLNISTQFNSTDRQFVAHGVAARVCHLPCQPLRSECQSQALIHNLQQPLCWRLEFPDAKVRSGIFGDNQWSCIFDGSRFGCSVDGFCDRWPGVLKNIDTFKMDSSLDYIPTSAKWLDLRTPKGHNDIDMQQHPNWWHSF